MQAVFVDGVANLLGLPEDRARLREMLAAPQGAAQYSFRGLPKTAYFQKSATTGWVFAISVPKGQ